MCYARVTQFATSILGCGCGLGSDDIEVADMLQGFCNDEKYFQDNPVMDDNGPTDKDCRSAFSCLRIPRYANELQALIWALRVCMLVYVRACKSAYLNRVELGTVCANQFACLDQQWRAGPRGFKLPFSMAKGFPGLSAIGTDGSTTMSICWIDAMAGKRASLIKRYWLSPRLIW